MNEERKEKGLLIVFEGLDRCGKTTQINLLHQKLNALSIVNTVLKFPNRDTPIGKVIDSYLKNEIELDDRAVHLLFSANRWETAEYITTLLDSGTIIIVDRYTYSGAAYTAAKWKNMSSLEKLKCMPLLDWCMASDTGLPEPDIIFYLDVPVAAISDRFGYGKERYEKDMFLIEVEKMYKKIMTMVHVEKWNIIDGDREIEIIHNDIFEIVKR